MKQVARNTTTNVVEMIGSPLGDRIGCAIETIADATLAQIRAALAQPNGGVTLSADHATVTALPVPPPTQAEQDQAAARNAVLTLAQSAVGQAIGVLTAIQVRALVAVLLHKNGAIKPDGTIRPLADWA